MKPQTLQFDELLNNYESALNEMGFGYSSRLRMLQCAGRLVRRHESRGHPVLDDGIIAEHFHNADQRLCEGKIGVPHYGQLMRDIQRFLNYTKSGTVETPYPLKGSRYLLTPEFERISSEYLASGSFHPNTRNDMRWVTHKYFMWLKKEGYDDLMQVGAAELQAFLLECSRQLTPNSMHDIKLHLKKLYAYLYSENLVEASFEALLSFRVNREVKIFPAMSRAEVEKLLAAIDRKTKGGKRAYAAMLLGADLGLRACDVVALELCNIDWINGEIKIVQAKTNIPVVLPLMQRVGEALQDYILNARPRTEALQIFIRLNKPHTPLKAAVTLGEIYRDCCKAAGIGISKRFHNLRRSLGTAMVTNGVPVETAAQVFGDAQTNSMKQYISLDSTHLKQCALPFDGIAQIGGDSI